MPPVATTGMPVRSAIAAVAETVVPPCAEVPQATARSRAAIFMTGAEVSRSRSLAAVPTVIRPAMTATVAGTAPAVRTSASIIAAVWRLVGCGRP